MTEKMTLATPDGTVVIALVTYDPTAAIETAKATIEGAALAIAAVNPTAAVALKTVALLGGWLFNRLKADRVKPALLALAKQLETTQSDYARKDEFADLLEEA